MKKEKYKSVLNDKQKMPQIVCIEPVFRQPTGHEKEYILKNWSVTFKNKMPSLFPNIFNFVMAVLGFIFCCLSIVNIFNEFAVFLLSALIAAGFITLVVSYYKNSKQASLEYHNLQDGFFTVSDTIATNLELICSYRESDDGRIYAYVNILNHEQVLLVKNVEIPTEIGKDLFHRNVKEFPCLLISIQDRKELLAIPKILN